MKFNIKAILFAGLTIAVFSPAGAQAQQAPAPVAPAAQPAPMPNPNNATGTVTAVDTAANTINVHDRRTDTDMVIAVTPETKYSKSSNVGVAGLATGNVVEIMTPPDATPGATTIEGGRITVIPAMPVHAITNPRVTVGTVTTTVPSLTVTTSAGTVVTIVTTPTMEVWSTQNGTLADVAVGNRVTVMGKNDGTTLTARMVRIMPARMRRPRPAAAPAN
jgi:hypothetical protein